VSPAFAGCRVRAGRRYRTARGFVSGWCRLALDQSSLLEVKGSRVSGLLGTPGTLLEAAYRGGLSHFKSRGI